MDETPTDDAVWEAAQSKKYRKIRTLQIILIVMAGAALITSMAFAMAAANRYERDLQQAKVECDEAGGVLIDWVCFNQTVVIRP